LETEHVFVANRSVTAEAIFANNFQPFLASLSFNAPQTSEIDRDLAPNVLVQILERLLNDPPRSFGEEQKENLIYAIQVRYNRLGERVPPPVESVMVLVKLLESPDSRLAKLLQRTGSRGTASLDACKEMLAGVETRDIAYPQIANALLFTAIVQDGNSFDTGIFVQGLRQHRAGSQIDWTDVVSGFDQDYVRITKKQFLALYNALLPLAREYVNFDIQSLWGGDWQNFDAQLSFVVAFLSTTSEELNVMQIPKLRQAFDLTDFATASESVRAFAEQAIKHPLVSRDATSALFTMIFRSQETYNLAQALDIPATLINQNMTIFVCAASAVPKPWGPLQDQALKQLFYPFLRKRIDNYDFVMHSLWQHDKGWIAARMVELYQTEQNLLSLIYEHAVDHGWLEALLTIQSNFALDLAAYAHSKGNCNLEEWSLQLVNSLGMINFAKALYEFLRGKLDDETIVQKEQGSPQTSPLRVQTVHALLSLIGDTLPEDMTVQLYRLCLQGYPRLFNYGEDEKRNAVIEGNDEERGSVLSPAALSEMEERYKEMYGGNTNPDALVAELNRLKVSEDPADQELFAAMLYGLFEEYHCFGEYPNEALATTAVLFGGLVSYRVLSGIPEQAAIFGIFEAVSEYTPEDPMYRFGLQALIHLLPRLKEWPHLAERILHTPNLQNTQVIPAAQTVLQEMQQENGGINGEETNGLTNGALEDELPADTVPPFSAIRVDPPLRENFYEEPDEDISDKVTFVLNNVSKRNFEEKFKEIENTLEDKYHQWFAHYLVEELAKSQPNFQGLYLQLLENFNKRLLWAEVLRETYASCQRMLNAQATMDNASERTTLKNLAGWLGAITLARDQPILYRNLSFKDLLIEGHATQRLIVVIPFTCKTLLQAAHSKAFRPPNPWIVELLGVLSELYHCIPELKLNMKFEIEMLCRDLNVDIKDIAPLDVIRSRPLLENPMMTAYMPDGGPDAFGDNLLMSLSKRSPNDRFQPDAVINAVPDLGNMLQIPQAVGNISQQQMRDIFVTAAQQAIYEIIAPVVERSVTIAAISTSELIQKDFATEGDESKVTSSSHTMVKALSGSLALVTCKEPLRMSITNNIRLYANRHLHEQLPEGQILMFVNDNIDTVCSLVERAAEEHSLSEIDLQLQQSVEERRQHNEQRPNEPFMPAPVNRWATLIPEPYSQDRSGLNRQQLAIYEEFGRQVRIPPPAHGSNASVDNSRQLPDVLSDNFGLPTPGEAPALPSQPGRLQPGQTNPGHAADGFLDEGATLQRVLQLLTELQRTCREASEEHISEIGEGAAIRHIYEQLVRLLDAAAHRDNICLYAGTQCLRVIYGDNASRLEVEVFVRLITQVCRISVHAGRHITMQLATFEEDPIFNAAATISLRTEGLIDVQNIDTQVARALSARRKAVLPYLKDVLDEMLLGESPVALRTDFVLTYDALNGWLNDEPDLKIAREIMFKLQIPAGQLNGLPSPSSDHKNDQLEYIFEEWVRLQRKETPEPSYLAFLQQLHDHRVIVDPVDTLAFFRTCLNMSCASFDRLSNMPYPTHDQVFIEADALAKLIAYMIIYQGPIEGNAQVQRAKSLDAILRLIILIMNDHHNKQRDHWNGRIYYRLFSALLCELYSNREQMTPEEEQEIYAVFARALLVTQPRYFSGFTYHWLTLLTHRLLIPAFLSGNGRSNGGWFVFGKLVECLLTNLEELLALPETPPVVQDFYRGSIRLFTLIHHDFPEYLSENHVILNSQIPMQCIQLQNIVNSAASRMTIRDQPDPFLAGLKINRLDASRHAPVEQTDVRRILADAGIDAAVDRVLTSNVIEDTPLATILSVIDSPGRPELIINALVFHLGVHATQGSPAFSAGAAPGRLIDRLVRDTIPSTRVSLIHAMSNQVRFVSSHTQYFSTALQHLFSAGTQEIQELILRVLCERLVVARPHPWGLIVLMLEMVKNPSVDLWGLPWVQAAPQVENMLRGIAREQSLAREQNQEFGGRMGRLRAES
jgi:CCR4-NOT transcription complex subunit 1